jgi:hypothetical protein
MLQVNVRQLVEIITSSQALSLISAVVFTARSIPVRGERGRTELKPGVDVAPRLSAGIRRPMLRV